jgi:hypothetical protein
MAGNYKMKLTWGRRQMLCSMAGVQSHTGVEIYQLRHPYRYNEYL